MRANRPAKCPVAARGVKDIMASDPSDFKERCCSKDEANACEGKPSQVVDHGCYGNFGHILININTTKIIVATRIPKKTSFFGPT